MKFLCKCQIKVVVVVLKFPNVDTELIRIMKYEVLVQVSD